MENAYKICSEMISIEKLFESIPVAVALVGRNGEHLLLNQALASISGLNARDLVGRKIAELSKESGENSKRDFRYFDAGLDVPDHEVMVGDQIFLVSVKPVRNSSGFAIAEIVALANITANKATENKLIEANKQLKYLSSHDVLTDLINSRTYYEVCERFVNMAHRDGSPFAVLFADVDYFKSINDTYGHEAGDTVLKEVSACIAKHCRSCDIVGRIGGEEFSVFLPNTDCVGAMKHAETLRGKIEELMPMANGKPVKVTISIGVAASPPRYDTIADIQNAADCAMYRAKQEGRNRVVRYS